MRSRGREARPLCQRSRSNRVRVAILFNPNAGRGKGAAVAARFEGETSRAGHSVRTIDVTKESGGTGTVNGSVGEMVEWSDAVVIVGGDGTVHHTLPVLMRHRRPVYHAAMGTENLFARQFGHGRSAERFLRAMESNSIQGIDVATFSTHAATPNATPFAIMASLGPDASIVHRLSKLRSGPISHLSYLKPTLMELRSPRVPTLTVRVDGRDLVRQKSGMLLIANMRQYAVRLNPASRADPTDGLLDVVFFPGRSVISVAFAVVAARLGVAGRGRASRGKHVEVEVEASDDCLPQVDGEALAVAAPTEGSEIPSGGRRCLTAQVVPNSLDVFVMQ